MIRFKQQQKKEQVDYYCSNFLNLIYLSIDGNGITKAESLGF